MLTIPTGLTLMDLKWRDTRAARRARDALIYDHGLHCLDDILDYETSEIHSHVNPDNNIWIELCYALKLSNVPLDEDWTAYVNSMVKDL